jgi:hypothetical protein
MKLIFFHHENFLLKIFSVRRRRSYQGFKNISFTDLLRKTEETSF